MIQELKPLVIAGFIWFIAAHSYGASIPEQLLEMPIPLISGKSTTLSEYNGKKPVYLKFWATWCQPCMKEMPHFQHAQEQYGKEIEIISVNLGINDNLEAVNRVITKFGLTMPTSIDKSGDLAQAFKMIGTPYHLLFDRNMNLVHRGHEASESLDNKIDLLSQSKAVEFIDSELLIETESDISIDAGDDKPHALFFTATWCDWYLKDTRPAVSQNCVKAQHMMNTLVKAYPEVSWHGVISRLWTGEKDLEDYKKKYMIQHPIEIDRSNRLFHQYSIKTMPTMLLIQNGKVSKEITNFSDIETVKEYFKEQ